MIIVTVWMALVPIPRGLNNFFQTTSASIQEYSLLFHWKQLTQPLSVHLEPAKSTESSGFQDYGLLQFYRLHEHHRH